MYAFNNYLLNTKTELSLRRNSESVCGSVAQQSPTLYDPTNYSPPGSSVRGIFHGRILEQVAIPSSRGSSQPKNQTHIFYVSCIGRQILYQLAPPGELQKVSMEECWRFFLCSQHFPCHLSCRQNIYFFTKNRHDIKNLW